MKETMQAGVPGTRHAVQPQTENKGKRMSKPYVPHGMERIKLSNLKQLETILSPNFHNATLITKPFRNFILKLAKGQLSLQTLTDIFS